MAFLYYNLDKSKLQHNDSFVFQLKNKYLFAQDI